jgi:hypothetical protein
MIVTANLNEAWDYGDTQRHGDMDRFVNRILKQKWTPDVLAVQEVRRSSAQYVAKKLSARSGLPFRVVVLPPSNPFQPYKGRAGAYETSIIANTKTMRIVNNGGMMPTAARPEHVVEPHDPVFFQSYALLQKRSSDENFAMMSVHLYPRGYLANMDLDKSYRKKWADQMRRKLVERYGGRANLNYVLAGDFNQSVCLRGHWSRCFTKSPFATALTRAGYENTSKDQGEVDLIWSRGKPNAYHLWDRKLKSMPAAKRYSDHPFRWSLLGPDVYAPTAPTPMTLDLYARDFGSRPPAVTVKWTKSEDRGGVGVSRYQFQKKTNDGDWANLDPSGRVWHHDYDLKWGQTVRYRMRVFDKNRNVSGWVVRKVDVTRDNIKKV